MKSPDIREAISNSLTPYQVAALADPIARLSSLLENLVPEVPISVSADLSAIRLGEIPLIFLGSNQWWIHRFSSFELSNNRATNTAKVYSSLAPSFPSAKIFHTVIPEKDTLCLELLFSDYFADYLAIKYCSKSFVDLYSRLTGSQALLFPHDLLSRCSELDFSYFDSHLPTRLYLLLADQLVLALGGPSDWMNRLLPLQRSHMWLDLGKKLSSEYSGEMTDVVSSVEFVRVKDPLANTLSSPLRNTKTGTTNSNPIIDMKVLVLGDSHSSIIGASKLTDIISSIFREVDFAWNPYCIHGLPEEYAPETYDVVISEIAERFIYGTL